MLQAPAFYFPTSTVIIDDDQLYSELLVDRLKLNQPAKCYENCRFLLAQKNNDFLTTNEDIKNLSTSDRVQKIKEAIAEKKDTLHNLVSVIVSDFHMNDMNGLEFFEQIKSPFVYKIIISNFITPPYDEEIKEAQNAGIIHASLEKGPNLKEALPQAIWTGQRKFFTKLTNLIFEGSGFQNHLSDTGLASHFINMVESFRPQYIWPESDLASFHFEKPTHKKNIFITTKGEIDALLDGYHAESAQPKTIEQLQSGDYMICHKNPQNIDGTEWAYHLRPAKKIEGANSTFLLHSIEESE